MRIYALAIAFIVSIAFAHAQSFTLGGDVEKPATISMSDFEKLPTIEVKGKDKDGKEHVFKGATLFSVVQSAGIPASSKSFMSYVQITAADNYNAIFTVAELDPAFSSQTIFLAVSVDGKPLPKGEGPFRVVAPNDKKHARWVREVTALKLVTVK